MNGKNSGGGPMRMRLCQSCAEKLKAINYTVDEIVTEPTRYSRCGMGVCNFSGELCLYRVVKVREYRPRARAQYPRKDTRAKHREAFRDW